MTSKTSIWPHSSTASGRVLFLVNHRFISGTTYIATGTHFPPCQIVLYFPYTKPLFPVGCRNLCPFDSNPLLLPLDVDNNYQNEKPKSKLDWYRNLRFKKNTTENKDFLDDHFFQTIIGSWLPTRSGNESCCYFFDIFWIFDRNKKKERKNRRQMFSLSSECKRFNWEEEKSLAKVEASRKCQPAE